MSVAVWSGSGLAWDRELLALQRRLGPVFGRPEARASAGAFIDGLLSGISRKTGWLMAEQAGLDRPYDLPLKFRTAANVRDWLPCWREGGSDAERLCPAWAPDAGCHAGRTGAATELFGTSGTYHAGQAGRLGRERPRSS